MLTETALMRILQIMDDFFLNSNSIWHGMKVLHQACYYSPKSISKFHTTVRSSHFSTGDIEPNCEVWTGCAKYLLGNNHVHTVDGAKWSCLGGGLSPRCTIITLTLPGPRHLLPVSAMDAVVGGARFERKGDLIWASSPLHPAKHQAICWKHFLFYGISPMRPC
jgi:hypothetical protein